MCLHKHSWQCLVTSRLLSVWDVLFITWAICYLSCALCLARWSRPHDRSGDQIIWKLASSVERRAFSGPLRNWKVGVHSIHLADRKSNLQLPILGQGPHSTGHHCKWNQIMQHVADMRENKHRKFKKYQNWALIFLNHSQTVSLYTLL